MEFHNKLYELRKQKGLSQEEMANKLNVSRQTVSKWELGDSTPEMEKLVAISDLLEISLDELVLDKVVEPVTEKKDYTLIKKDAKKGLKIIGIILGILLLVDMASMIIYFCINGFPK